jgi:multidrug resistance protein, MATE family
MGLRIADIGVIEAGAHAIAINIASFVFMFFIALGHAVTVRASHAIGRNAFDEARRVVILGLATIAVIATITSIVTYVLRGALPLLFNQDVGVVLLASQFLIFAAAFQFFDGVQAMAICSLRAYKDTAVPSGIQFFAFWVVGMPLGIFLPGSIIGGNQIGSEGVWISFCISLALSSAILLSRLYWKVFR